MRKKKYSKKLKTTLTNALNYGNFIKIKDSERARISEQQQPQQSNGVCVLAGFYLRFKKCRKAESTKEGVENGRWEGELKIRTREHRH